MSLNNLDTATQEDIHLPEAPKKPSPMISLGEKVGPNEMLDVGWQAMRLMLPQKTEVEVTNSNAKVTQMEVTRQGLGPLDTDFGKFWQGCFETNDNWGRYHTLIACPEMDVQTGMPKFKNPENILVRTDSGCVTGQVFHDKTCDCRQQLHQAMEEINARGEGIIVHIPGQDGRGMGLDFKLGTLYIQQRLGADTIQSATLLRFVTSVRNASRELMDMGELEKSKDVINQAMGLEQDAEALWAEGKHEMAFELIENVRADIVEIVNDVRRNLKMSDIDHRTYEGVIAILKTLGIAPGTKINLATNNPHKMEVFEKNGYEVINTPVIAQNAGDIEKHLAAKAAYMGHMISNDDIHHMVAPEPLFAASEDPEHTPDEMMYMI